MRLPERAVKYAPTKPVDITHRRRNTVRRFPLFCAAVTAVLILGCASNKTSAKDDFIRWHDEPKKELISASQGSVDTNQRRANSQELMKALKEGDSIKAKTLLNDKIDVNYADENGTLLMYAARFGNKEIFDFLFERDADFNAVGIYGLTALICCVNSENYSSYIADKLISGRKQTSPDSIKENKPDINAKNDTGITALMYAAKKGNLDATSLLIANGADVNIRNVEGKTAVIYASMSGKSDIVKVLVHNGADVNIAGEDGYTALVFGIGSGDKETVRTLIEAGADVDAKVNYGLTPLMIATIGTRIEHFSGFNKSAYRNDLENIKMLVENGANVNATSDDGATPLMSAVYSGELEISKYLIENGAIINARKNDGYTPLITAAEIGELEIVEYLIEKGADVNMKTNDGKTALSMATNGRYKNFYIADYLRQHGAKE